MLYLFILFSSGPQIMEGCSLHSGWVFLTQPVLLEMLSQTHSVDCFPGEPKSSQIDNKDISTPCPWYTNHSQMPHTCLEAVLQFLDIVLRELFSSFFLLSYFLVFDVYTDYLQVHESFFSSKEVFQTSFPNP